MRRTAGLAILGGPPSATCPPLPLPPAARRLLLAGLPALIIGSVVVSTIWGDHGLLRRERLTRELESANTALAGIERENHQTLRDLTLLEEDPVALERLIADELAQARDGTVLYRFEDAQ